MRAIMTDQVGGRPRRWGGRPGAGGGQQAPAIRTAFGQQHGAIKCSTKPLPDGVHLTPKSVIRAFKRCWLGSCAMRKRQRLSPSVLMRVSGDHVMVTCRHAMELVHPWDNRYYGAVGTCGTPPGVGGRGGGGARPRRRPPHPRSGTAARRTAGCGGDGAAGAGAVPHGG